MQTRLPRRVLLFQGSGVMASRESGRARAELRLYGERGAIISRLQPARLRLSRRRDVWDVPLAAHSAASGIHFARRGRVMALAGLSRQRKAWPATIEGLSQTFREMPPGWVCLDNGNRAH